MEEQIKPNNLEEKNLFQKIKKKPIFISLIFLLVFLPLLIFIFKQKKITPSNKLNQSLNEKITPLSKISESFQGLSSEKKGDIQLSLLDYEVDLNKTFLVDLIGDSEGEDVVGIDILIKFNPKEIEFISANSSLDNFLLKTQIINNDIISLTFVKKLTTEEKTILSKNKIATLQLKPIIRGKSSFELLAVNEKRKTFFINEKTEIFYPKLSEKIIVDIK